MLKRYSDFKHDWERQHLEKSRDLVFKNTFQDIEEILTTCSANGTRFEFECYDTSHLYNLAHFLDRGLVKAPHWFRPSLAYLRDSTHPEDVAHMKRTADRLFGDQYVGQFWGGTFADANCSHVRCPGWFSTGRLGRLTLAVQRNLAESNAQQVLKARQVLEGLSVEVATPDEAEKFSSLKEEIKLISRPASECLHRPR